MADIEHDDYCPDKGDQRCDCDWGARVRADERAKALEFCCADTEPDIRERIAKEIEEEMAAPRESDEWTDGWNAARAEAARITRGGAR